MYLVNHLNRNKTDGLSPLFEMLYCIELICIVMANVLGGALIYVMYSTTIFHRNIRLRIIFVAINIVVFSWSRIVVMDHQYFGPSEKVINWYLIIASIQQEVYLSYGVLLISILAVDRWTATKYWAWFEQNNKSTLVYFFAQEIIVHVAAYFEGWLLTYEILESSTTSIYFSFMTIFGVIVYTIIYRYNLRELERMKLKAQMDYYSVSRTYQIKENLALLRFFTKLAIPLMISYIPSYTFYFLYGLQIGSTNFQYISIAMFDLTLSVSSVILLLCIPYHERKIIRILLGQSIEKKSHSSMSSAVVTNAYFTMLTNEWK